MRAFATAALLCALALAASACEGSGSRSTTSFSDENLTSRGFADKAAAAIITGTDLQAAPAANGAVLVSSTTSLSTFTLDVGDQYDAYKRDKSKLQAELAAVVKRAKTTMARGNGGVAFKTARKDVFPLLKPSTAFRRLTDNAATSSFPGGLRVAYVVEKADSSFFVTDRDVSRWGRPLAELHRIALANLLRETRREQPLKCEKQLCGWASGDGFDATRFIVPELRAAIVRKIGPAVYAVPRESVYVALPVKYAKRIRAKVDHDFVTAPNPVSRDLFVERGGQIVVYSG